jgi:ubiquinone/menaquinone biosynthesis C-methylase UbiE
MEAMKLNAAEKLLMNNPLRAGIQRWYETPLLIRLGGKLDGARVLEVGCGRGVGTELLLTRFGAREVVAFDLDPDQVRKAERRLARFGGRVRLGVGDAEAIAEPDAAFDAVLDFGIIHHVPNWQTSVREIARVLKPGGRFYFEELTANALNRWVTRAFFVHPTENRFSADAFVAEIERNGLRVGQRFVKLGLNEDFVIGVGTKR